MTDGEIFRRLAEIAADATGDDREVEFVCECVTVLVMTTLDVGVHGYREISDEDTERIREIVERKVHDLLLTEAAKINGT
jgi:hypothetical protein